MSTLHQTKIIPRAIIHVTAKGKNTLHINYGRRIYAILRRYTPEVTESGMNQCYAELTGLRTFFKMTYAEMVASILPPKKSPWKYYESADDDYSGFEGYFESDSEFEKFLNGIQNVVRH